MPEPAQIDDGMAELLREALRLDHFYAVLTAEKVVQIFPKSCTFIYAPGEYVIHQGEEFRDVYIIQTGSVNITQTMGSAAAHLATLGPGQLFGEIALISDGVRVANAIAAESSRIFQLKYPDVRRILEENKELGEHLLKLAQSRLP